MQPSRLSRSEFKAQLKLHFPFVESFELLDVDNQSLKIPFCFGFDPRQVPQITFGPCTKMDFSNYTFYDTEGGYLAKHNILLCYQWNSNSVFCQVRFLSDRGPCRKITQFSVDLESENSVCLGDLLLNLIGLKRKRPVPEGCVEFIGGVHPDAYLEIMGSSESVQATYEGKMTINYATLKSSWPNRFERLYCYGWAWDLDAPIPENHIRLPTPQEAALFWFQPRNIKHFDCRNLANYQQSPVPCEIEHYVQSLGDDSGSFEFDDSTDSSFL